MNFHNLLVEPAKFNATWKASADTTALVSVPNNGRDFAAGDWFSLQAWDAIAETISDQLITGFIESVSVSPGEILLSVFVNGKFVRATAGES